MNSNDPGFPRKDNDPNRLPNPNKVTQDLAKSKANPPIPALDPNVGLRTDKPIDKQPFKAEHQKDQAENKAREAVVEDETTEEEINARKEDYRRPPSELIPSSDRTLGHTCTLTITTDRRAHFAAPNHGLRDGQKVVLSGFITSPSILGENVVSPLSKHSFTIERQVHSIGQNGDVGSWTLP